MGGYKNNCLATMFEDSSAYILTANESLIVITKEKQDKDEYMKRTFLLDNIRTHLHLFVAKGNTTS